MADRLAALLASLTFNGIDFVEVASDDQTQLVVHFLNAVKVDGTLTSATPVTITGGEAIPTVPVGPITSPDDWSVDEEGRPLLALATPFAGDFTTYTLAIASPALDPYYAASAFSFKARCPSDLDCAEPCIECPPPGGESPPIDRMAKDFQSFKRALSDYSTAAYPDWHERSEADVGMTLLELFAAVGDDLSYLQDRIAAEATLPTATQRRSVVRHARLVDYDPRPATCARVVVQVDVALGPVPAGAVLTASSADSGLVSFELGHGMIDPATGEVDTTPLTVDSRWNSGISPYWWDDSRRCLPAGATELWIKGHGYGFLVGDPQLGTTGLALLIDTKAASDVDPPIREVVHLTAAEEHRDALLGEQVTRLAWTPEEAMRFEHDLTRTQVAGNLLPATEGRRYTDRFAIEPTGTGAHPTAAIVRTGPDADCNDAVPVYLYTLSQGRLGWLAPTARPGDLIVPGEDDLPLPELHVTQLATVSGDPDRPWRWRRRLLDAAPFEDAFTVDPVRFTAGEYDGDDGDSVRFGDGRFGERPPQGAVFEVTYRVTRGAVGNVAADTITGIDPSMSSIIKRATNPFAATGGADEEPLDAVRARAPYAFRVRRLRAVRAADYDEAAGSLPWVLDAGTAFRWTGSWLTVFTTAAPHGGGAATVDEELQLVSLLDRRRLAGYEVYEPAPRYVGIDLIVTVCARPTALRGEVEAAVLTELGTGVRHDGAPAFFAPDRFGFGTPLERSELEIAAQAAMGVAGVTCLRYRRRGLVAKFEPMPETVLVGRDEIIRVLNDPSRPERGSLRVVVQGGK
jgi:hypothetical protein